MNPRSRLESLWLHKAPILWGIASISLTATGAYSWFTNTPVFLEPGLSVFLGAVYGGIGLVWEWTVQQQIRTEQMVREAKQMINEMEADNGNNE